MYEFELILGRCDANSPLLTSSIFFPKIGEE